MITMLFQWKISVLVFIQIVNRMKIVDSHDSSDHISECFYYDGGAPAGRDNVTFSCIGVDNENDIFRNDGILCRNRGSSSYARGWFGQIEFKSCRDSIILREYHRGYPNLHTILISNDEKPTLRLSKFDMEKSFGTLSYKQLQALNGTSKHIGAIIQTNKLTIK